MTLDAVITDIGYSSPLKFKVVGGNLRTTAFSVLYTIPRSDSKDMRLNTEKDYKAMLDDVSGKVRLDITELVSNFSSINTIRL